MTSVLSQLEQYECRPVVVTFYKEKKNQQTALIETNCQFQMIADPELKLYDIFTLGRLPVSRTMWNVSSMNVYASMAAGGQYQVTADLEESQNFKAGGDYVITESGQVIYSFQGESATHRPSVEEILGALQANHKK